tara:strand:+ start:190 stop:459 length:270 start_codon:yes stop_codon:yes gene_type:complete
MSLFQDGHNNAIGEFRNEYTYFEYRLSEGDAPNQGTWGLENGFKHEIAMSNDSVRFANIKKTVAYICVDIDDEGNPIIEKWKIKHNWMK